jgi:hypothetical protein
MTPADGQEICSRISLSRQEPLLGTAAHVEVWFMLTYAGPFGAHAFEESDLPDPVKQHLAAELERLPHARLQLIKPHPAQSEERIEFLVVQGLEDDPLYLRFELSSYEDIVDIDIDGIVNSERALANQALREPFYLVCTNGRRDPCCVQSGLPVFQTLRDSLGVLVWECSHVGGHRFAANVLMFPHGLYYGRIQQSQVGELLTAGQRGRILLGNLRGRACHTPVVQAAEVLLRREVGNVDLGAYRLIDEQQVAEDQWMIGFEDPAGGEIHRLSIESSTSSKFDRASCRSDKLAPVTTYHLRSIDVEAI